MKRRQFSNMANHVRIVGEKSNWHWRPPRKAQRLDPVRQFAVRRDQTGWRVVNGHGFVLAAGFATDAAALQWIRLNAVGAKCG